MAVPQVVVGRFKCSSSGANHDGEWINVGQVGDRCQTLAVSWQDTTSLTNTGVMEPGGRVRDAHAQEASD